LVVKVAELVGKHAMSVPATSRLMHALCCLEYHPTLLSLESCVEISIRVVLSVREVEKHVTLVFLLVDETELASPESRAAPLELAVALCLIISVGVAPAIMHARLNVLLRVAVLGLPISLDLL
jgi:hypothetical protein